MPSMAAMTLNDGVANQTYSAATASAGDRSPAVWRDNAHGSYLNAHPTLTMVTRDNGKRTARHVSFTFRYPVAYTDPVTFLERILAVIPLSVECTLPTNIDPANLRAAVRLMGAALTNTLILDAVETGYAPT